MLACLLRFRFLQARIIVEALRVLGNQEGALLLLAGRVHGRAVHVGRDRDRVRGGEPLLRLVDQDLVGGGMALVESQVP